MIRQAFPIPNFLAIRMETTCWKQTLITSKKFTASFFICMTPAIDIMNGAAS